VKSSLLTAIIFFASAFVSAQTSPGTTSTVSNEYKFEVFGGYSHQTSSRGLNGWIAEGAYRFDPHWAAVADFSGHYKTESVGVFSVSDKTHYFLFGSRYYFREVDVDDQRFNPYVHALFGGGHQNTNASGVELSDTGFAFTVGGGADWYFNERFSARGQAELLKTNFFSNGDTHTRLSLGVVYHF